MRWVWPEVGAKLDWALFALVGVLTLVIGTALGFNFSRGVVALLIHAVALLALAGYLTAKGVWRPVPAALATFGWICASSGIMSHASYIATCANLPLQDATLAAIDAAFGIDVTAIARATGTSPTLSAISAFAYGHTADALFIGCFVLLLSRKFARISDTLTVLLLGMTATLVLSALVPAAGAFVHLGLDDTSLGALAGKDAGVWHLAHFNALRDGSMRAFPTTDWQGLVTFPSFHTIYALTAAYAFWGTRWLALPGALFAAAVIYSTIPVGGHYAVDVVAGCAIFAASVAFVGRRRAARLGSTTPALFWPWPVLAGARA